MRLKLVDEVTGEPSEPARFDLVFTRRYGARAGSLSLSAGEYHRPLVMAVAYAGNIVQSDFMDEFATPRHLKVRRLEDGITCRVDADEPHRLHLIPWVDKEHAVLDRERSLSAFMAALPAAMREHMGRMIEADFESLGIFRGRLLDMYGTPLEGNLQ